MATIRERILDYLKEHPEGASDADLTGALRLKYRAQANQCCRLLAEERKISRRRVAGVLRNFYLDPEGEQVTEPPSAQEPPMVLQPVPERPWYWEGNVQAAAIRYLRGRGYTIVSYADTARHQRGKDICAAGPTGSLWVTVKGYPQGTERTHPSTQAGIWFEGALFDVVDWRGEDESAEIALALPDFPRYRRLAKRVRWLQRPARFSFIWVRQDGTVEQEGAIVESAETAE